MPLIARRPLFFYGCDVFSKTAYFYPVLEVSPIEEPSKLEYIFMNNKPHTMLMKGCRDAELFIDCVKQMGRLPGTSIYDTKWLTENLVDETGTPLDGMAVFELFKKGYHRLLFASKYKILGFEAWVELKNKEGGSSWLQIGRDIRIHPTNNHYIIDTKDFLKFEFRYMNKITHPFFPVMDHHYVIKLINPHLDDTFYVGRAFPRKYEEDLCVHTAMAKRFENEDNAIAFAVGNETITNHGFHIVRIDQETYVV